MSPTLHVILSATFQQNHRCSRTQPKDRAHCLRTQPKDKAETPQTLELKQEAFRTNVFINKSKRLQSKKQHLTNHDVRTKLKPRHKVQGNTRIETQT